MSRAKETRGLEKAWWAQKLELEIQNETISLPVSPATIVAVLFVLLSLLKLLCGAASRKRKAFVEASHILLMEHTPAAQNALAQLKASVGNDAAAFADAAKKYSKCPSKKQGGNLGRFGPGDMAPAFDKISFDPQTPLHATIGPFQTHFGWHLLYIHARDLGDEQ